MIEYGKHDYFQGKHRGINVTHFKAVDKNGTAWSMLRNEKTPSPQEALKRAEANKAMVRPIKVYAETKHGTSKVIVSSST